MISNSQLHEFGLEINLEKTTTNAKISMSQKYFNADQVLVW